MKGKEEDEERNENICPQRTDRQSNTQRTLNAKTEATLILCGSSGERANQIFLVYIIIYPGKRVFVREITHYGQDSLTLGC